MTKGMLILAAMAGTALAILIQGLIIVWRTRFYPDRARWAGNLLLITAGATLMLGITGLEFAMSVTTEYQFSTQQIEFFDPMLLRAQLETLLGTVLLMGFITQPLLAKNLFRGNAQRTSLEVGAAIYAIIIRDHWVLLAMILAGLSFLISIAQIIVLVVEFMLVWLLYAVASRVFK